MQRECNLERRVNCMAIGSECRLSCKDLQGMSMYEGTSLLPDLAKVETAAASADDSLS